VSPNNLSALFFWSWTELLKEEYIPALPAALSPSFALAAIALLAFQKSGAAELAGPLFINADRSSAFISRLSDAPLPS
jgi:hypothetical protein